MGCGNKRGIEAKNKIKIMCKVSDFSECPHYRKAVADDAAWTAEVEKAKTAIVEQMRGLGLNPDTVMIQIENAAETRVELLAARKEARRYPRVQMKTSREGNDSFVTNPIHDKERELAATFDAMLKNLGFGAKVEKVQTRIGDAASDGREGNEDAGRGRTADDFRAAVLESLNTL